MTLDGKTRQRLQFLARVIRKECRHLETTDGRLFAQPFTVERARSLETDADLAEWVEAFVGRFGRLQDAVGDKLLPMLLTALGSGQVRSWITWIARNDLVYWLPPRNGW